MNLHLAKCLHLHLQYTVHLHSVEVVRNPVPINLGSTYRASNCWMSESEAIILMPPPYSLQYTPLPSPPPLQWNMDLSLNTDLTSSVSDWQQGTVREIFICGLLLKEAPGMLIRDLTAPIQTLSKIYSGAPMNKM